jgi:hypothetical protein
VSGRVRPTSTGRRYPLFESPPPARVILARALGITVDEAAQAIVALVEGGYGIAPRNPTNGMLVAYLEALTPPTGHEQVVTALGKARVRWQAMLAQGTAMSLSKKLLASVDRNPQGGDAQQAPSRSDESAPEGDAQTPSPNLSQGDTP